MFLYKAIVVDDEKSIRERLTHFFPWSDVGFEVVGSAENGCEALELIKQELPNVVLTDVLMPEMTGLELAKEIKLLYPEIKVIILSAYDDFKYAQDAIQHGVKGYMLKPLTKGDFYTVFNQLAGELDEDTELRKENETNEKWDAQELMLLDLIKGENLQKYSEEWHEQNQNFRVAIFSFEKVFKETSTFSIRQKIKELAVDFWERYRVPVLFYGNSLILIITDQKLMTRNVLKPKILMFADSLQHNLGEIFKGESNIVVGVGNEAQSLQEISRSYHEAVHASSYKYFSEYETVIFLEDLALNEGFNNDKVIQSNILDYVNDFEGKLMDSVLKGEMAEISMDVQYFFGALERSKGQNISEVRASCSEFVIMLIFKFKEKGFTLPSIDNQQVLGKIYEIDSLKELKRWLQQILGNISFDLTQNDDQNVNRYVLIAKEYVKSNYQEKITLIEMSNILFLHQAYFSGIFKKETGQNFIDYVNEVRIERAVQLLRETDHKVKLISDMVGFHSHSYFIKVFKNEKGVTPVTFRRQQKR